MKGALERYASHYLFLYASGVTGHISICSESFYFSWLCSLYIFFYTVKDIFTGFLLEHSAFCPFSLQHTIPNSKEQTVILTVS